MNRTGTVSNNVQNIPLDNSKGHSARQIKIKTIENRNPSRSGRESKINGMRYRIHCGLNPGDHSMNMPQAKQTNWMDWRSL